MSKPDENKIEEALNNFRKEFGDLIDKTLNAGVHAPNLVLVLEMAKINLATQYIQNAQRQMEMAAAAEMASKSPGGKSNIIPVGQIKLKK